MSVFMMLAASGLRESATQTFTSNATWTAPATTNSVDMVGKGAPGEPAGQDTTVAYTDVTTTYVRRDGGPDFVKTSRADDWIGQGSMTGKDYCDPPNYFCDPNTDPNCTVGSTIYSQYQTCYHYGAYVDPGGAATTGAASTAFGKTFPGGTGGPAVPASYSNVPVTPGQSYSIVVPPGGSVTITYLK